MSDGLALPTTWAVTDLGELRANRSVGVIPGKTPDQVFELYSVPSFDNKRPEVVKGADIGSNKQLVEPGTVLLCKINPRINRAWIVGEFTPHPKIASTEWIPFFPVPGLLPEYLTYFLQQDQVRDYLSANVSGVGGSLMRVRPTVIDRYPFPLPPLPEQRRIVAEIETQITRLDAAVAALERAETNLKRYRAAVLADAFEGRLVSTEADIARAEGRSYEPAERLLARLSSTRRETSIVPTLVPMLDESQLQQLPEGWAWSTLGQIFGVFVGATPSRRRADYWGGDIPWVSSGEVAFCRIRGTRETITLEGLRNSSTSVHPPGTVLLGMIGEGKTRGQVALLDIEACNNQNSAAIRVSEAGLPPEYVYRYLESQYERTRQLGSGNNQPALNKSRVQAMLIPIAPLAEQLRIVSEVERILSISDELKIALSKSLTRAECLRQAVLRKAFSGQLVPQDSTDEPASILLDRIRSDQQAQSASHKGRKRSAMVPRKPIQDSPERKPIMEILRSASNGLSPEELFRISGRSADDVDDFYAELRQAEAAGAVVEERKPDRSIILKRV